MKTALAQISPKIGDVEQNFALHKNIIESAVKDGADLVVFPELSLTGYQLQNLVPEVAISARKSKEIADAMMSGVDKLLDIVYSFIEVDERGVYYCSVGYYSNSDKTYYVHRKNYLPTYGMFDESRYLGSGKNARAFDTRFGKIGMLICEDFWHMSMPYLLWADGADIMLFVSASPGRGMSIAPKLSTSDSVEKLCETYAGFFTTYVVNCNRSGYEDGKNFSGGSFVVDPYGNMIDQAPYFEDSLFFVDMPVEKMVHARATLPMVRDEQFFRFSHNLSEIVEEKGL